MVDRRLTGWTSVIPAINILNFMKRSDINRLIRSAEKCFTIHGWTLPPHPRWDVTDFGLGEYGRYGLVLVNLAEEPEYCEKLMYALEGMTTPAHCHKKKKEDIICRWGELAVVLWHDATQKAGKPLSLKINGTVTEVVTGETLSLQAGERVTLVPGVYHEFFPTSAECIIGEVSTANDDLRDNFFVNPDTGRFPGIEEDEAPFLSLISDKA
jgi:D-lyxose ketol-isomerase